ncbi:MAG: 16S rRNA (adenine(1518)-N(6)/adenine(1519)-N(6))-dimethyltransferase RsmA [Bacteroidales bacterium]|nr:MAG: 16S rRNA (adenine(1518)-N(6)/adenine(1519)-N(6))-dimethyltransferase RsmA [Bacteroidales bacterium]
MPAVKPKKELGQHFLHDKRTAQRIVESLQAVNVDNVLEIGPGMGVLTVDLLAKYADKFWAVEIDKESVAYLNATLPALSKNILGEDFLKIDLSQKFRGKLAIIGNLPYNISSQIFFSILQNRQSVTEVVAMVQREVALRIAEKPGTRTYGILSVLLQAYYNINYLFTVSEGAFTPPPKVKSAVIRLTRNNTLKLNCNEELFLKVVKASFNQRRKTLRNSIRSGFASVEISEKFAQKRAEQLSVTDFVELTNEVEMFINKA